ncbi:MAG: hypothetical protein M1836_000606 [Candelina mexicana]|nr:MAG: hypothetical protein M1836_000606 [Candelina mexicana]
MSAIFRTSALRTVRVAPRAFSTSVRTRKSAMDPVKDAAKTVDKTLSQAAIKGLEVGQSATEKAKAAVGMDPKKDVHGNMEDAASQAKASAQHMSGEAKGKGQELAGEAKGKGQEMTGEAKGKGQEIAGEAKGKGQTMTGAVKGKAEELKGQAKGTAEEVKAKM